MALELLSWSDDGIALSNVVPRRYLSSWILNMTRERYAQASKD